MRPDSVLLAWLLEAINEEFFDRPGSFARKRIGLVRACDGSAIVVPVQAQLGGHSVITL